jgi:hypothetical protein
MRKITMLATGAALLLATAAGAQQQQPAAPAPAPAAPEGQQQQQAPTIQNINVVDIEQLPKATQDRVNEAIAGRTEADLKQLQGSIDARPDIKSALESKGMTSEQVIAASLAQDGTLTLITKKKAS